MTPPNIVSMGCDPQLMNIRTLLLQGAGYVVDEAYEKTAALSRAQCDSVDVLLICHSVAKYDRQWLIARIREKRELMPVKGGGKSGQQGGVKLDQWKYLKQGVLREEMRLERRPALPERQRV